MRHLSGILALALAAGGWLLAPAPAAGQAYGIYREYYAGIGGAGISDLTNNAAFPNSPTSTNILTELFDAPHDFADSYGTRLRAFVVPPLTGNYVFWTSSDDQSTLYLSLDENPARRTVIAKQSSWNGWEAWESSAEQKSAVISLVAGRRYYIEALQKEGGGGDSLSVGWQLPNSSQERPIPATRCIPFNGIPTARPSILLHPTNLVTFEGWPISLRVLAGDWAPVGYQWQQSGTNIPGATNCVYATSLTTNQSGVTFRCVLTNALGATTSQVATITVLVDNVAPSLSAVASAGLGAVQLVFSEAVSLASATNAANYSLSGGVAIQSASLAGDGRTVQLTTSPLVSERDYTLSVSRVSDLAPRANVIATNSTATFRAILPGIYREVFAGISGNAVADLTNSPSYPTDPTLAMLVTNYFEAPADWNDMYGTRMRALITAPASGAYTFWIASDDNSALLLSTNENPANVVKIAGVNGATGARQWTAEAGQQSSAIQLVAGRRYYLEALQKEGAGGDNLSVRWQLPDGTVEEPIPASRCAPVGLLAPTLVAGVTNLTVVEGDPALLSAACVNHDVLVYQWRRNGTNVPNATNSLLALTNALLADQGAAYSCLVTNILGAITSPPVALTVVPDTTAPAVVWAQNAGSNAVWLQYSERLQPASATNLANYTIQGGPLVLGASFGPNATTVILRTGPLVYGSNYTLQINSVKDVAQTPNTIASNTMVVFSAREYLAWSVGGSLISPAQMPVPGGWDVVGSGADIGGSADQCQFNFQQVTGDFDRVARLQDVSLEDLWAKVGLMARETLDANSRFAATLATPSLAGAFFESRSSTAGAATAAGSFPANYPNLWVRLKRAGSVFSGFASADGRAWVSLGTATIAMPTTIYLGAAAASRSTNRLVIAQFRDWGNVATNAVTIAAPAMEPLGPSSRRTSVAISELMYHPAPREDGLQTEFIELFNGQPFFEDLSGWRLSGSVDFTFPRGTILPGGAFLVIARNPADLRAASGATNILGPFTNNLPAGSGTVRLLNELGAVLLEVNYSSNPPWPAAADGAGHSLVLAQPSYGEGDARAWAASDQVGGTPGRMNGFGWEPARAVVVNEIRARSLPGEEDFVELYNHGSTTVDLSGCILTDDPQTNKYVFPSGTIISPGRWLAFRETQLGFGLNAGGETLYLLNAARTRVLDAVRYESQAAGVASGRYPDGSAQFYPMSPTLGSTNAAPAAAPIVINEIMYAPLSGDENDAYVELYNSSSNTVELGGWKLDGLGYEFPTNAALAPGAFAVVAKNPSRLQANYPILAEAPAWGPYPGTLKKNGESLSLLGLEGTVATNGLSTNWHPYLVDQVSFRTGGRWGRWTDGGGSSLELVDAHANRRLAPSWAGSIDLAKGPWTNLEITAQLSPNGNSTYSNDRLYLLLLGEGECLVDNVEVYVAGNATNLVLNATFESGVTDWNFLGTHDLSSWETAQGYQSARCLHVRASADGDTGPNTIRANLSQTIPAGSTVTLRAKVRWLRGCPEILFRLRGNWLEMVRRMPVPANLGTPGAANSCAVANLGPAITDVTHQPALPAASQPVLVTARVEDPDRVAAVALVYRIDPATTANSVVMRDDGIGGDAVAGDGLYTATLPGQAAGTIVAFRVQATDRLAASALFPSDAPARECLVRFGDPAPNSSFGTYRFWMTQATHDRWSSREKLSNEPLDVTFVYGNTRVIYNAGGLYSGSTWHAGGLSSPVNGAANYKITLPPDDPLLGTGDLNKLHGPGNGWDDETGQREKTCYWLAGQMGLPFSQQRFVNLYVNGNQRYFIFEDMQVPTSDFIKEYYPAAHAGNLFKDMFWYEFDDDAISFTAAAGVSLQKFLLADGAKDAARYRWTFQTRSAGETANDYTNLFALVDAANTQGAGYTAAVEALVDVDQWMRIAAFEHIIGNWDCWLTGGGQNLFTYKPDNDRWKLLVWDANICLGMYGIAYNGDLFAVGDGPLSNMYNNPPWRRHYWRALYDAANGPLRDDQAGAVMDARYAAFAASGIGAASPSAVKSWIAMRRLYILSQLATVEAPFAVSGALSRTNASQVLSLSGTAPVGIKEIQINGIAYPLTWTTVTNWALSVRLGPGTNSLAVQGYDTAGNLMTGASVALRVVNTAATDYPQNAVGIHEIMANPALPDAEYLELYNRSTTTTFDLSRWRLDGVDYTFPGNSLLAPQSYLVLAKSRAAYQAAYGTNAPLFGVYPGNLQGNGEVLALIKSDLVSSQDLVIDKLRYEDLAPWPTGTNRGAALQLVDASRDHRRAGNWAGVKEGWQYFSVTGTNLAATGYFQVYLMSLGDLFVDDFSLLDPASPTPTNLIVGGDFEAPFSEAWFMPSTNQMAFRSSTNVHAGHFSLHVVCTNTAQVSTNAKVRFSFNPPLNALKPYTFSFWYLPSTTNVLLRAGLSPAVALSFGRATGLPAQATPGASNSVSAALPDFPALWLNEVQPENRYGLADAAGERDPWVELYNNGASRIALSNCWLAASYTNLAQWAFPTSAVIEAGERLVIWLDGQPEQTTNREYHAGFRLPPTNGSVALSRSVAGSLQLVDYLNYSSLPANYSYGDLPDGQPIYRQMMPQGTPGATNSSTISLVHVYINEWMANNTFTIQNLASTAKNKYDDWFELYNPGTAPADLGGYYLSDAPGTLLDRIPAGFVVPPKGYLLVWADERTSLNTNRGDLHVNFKLSQAGEAIGLYAPDGQLVDSVVFGQQTNDVSMGHYPDGTGPVTFMLTPSPRAANRLVDLPPATPPSLVAPGLTLGNGTFSFSLGTETGRTYQVEYVDYLGATNWTALPPTYSGTGDLLPVTLSLTNAPQRYFRVIVVP